VLINSYLQEIAVQKINVLVVGAKRNGYRRAGLLFGETAATIPLSALTSHQVKELQSDRMLATQPAEAVVLSEAEHDELSRKSAIADALIMASQDNQFAGGPVEYLADLQAQLRIQTERANGLQTSNDTLQAQLDELQAKAPVKPDAAKAAHTAARR
jgi:hypothetical protein